MKVDRMSPLDSTFLHAEDSVSHMHVACISILDGPPPAYVDLLAMIGAKLQLVPRYRQVVQFVPLNLGRPVWSDDPHFNIEYHVRHSALPPPGGEEELRKLIGRVMAQQLDRNRPLWEIWMVEGLEEGRWALLSKTHHALVDGVAGSELLSVMFDLSPDASRPAGSNWRPAPPPSSLGLAAQALGDLVRSPYEQLRAIRATTRVPRQAISQSIEVALGLRAILSAARPTPPSSLNGPIGPHRRYAFTSVSVEDVKAIRKELGGSFNDVVLAAITGGFRNLLVSRGESVERPVRALVPVSVRGRDATGRAVGDGTLDNKISAMLADLPVGIDDPVQRLRAVSGQMRDLKDSMQAVAGEALTSLSGFAPPSLLALGTRIATKAAQRSINTVTTNVPGPQLPLYVLGRRMVRVYPYVPLAGQVRVGVAIFSYDGQVNFGVTGDYDTAPDIDVLCRGVEDAVRHMLKASPSSRAHKHKHAQKNRRHTLSHPT